MDPVAERYLAERVLTASPAELTAMLFDAAVGAARSAARLIDSGEFAAAAPRLLKAQEIVLELRSTLNHDAGPLAASLEALYTWCWTRLVDANLRHDPQACPEVLAVLEPLRDAWRTSCCTLVAQPA